MPISSKTLELGYARSEYHEFFIFAPQKIFFDLGSKLVHMVVGLGSEGLVLAIEVPMVLNARFDEFKPFQSDSTQPGPIEAQQPAPKHLGSIGPCVGITEGKPGRRWTLSILAPPIAIPWSQTGAN